MKQWLLLAVLILPACALLPPQDTRVRGYGAWMESPGTPWARAPSGFEGGFAFVRPGSTPDETIALEMYPLPYDGSTGGESLQGVVAEMAQAAERSSRFSNARYSSEPYVDSIEGNQCVAYELRYEDLKAAKRTERDAPMLLEIVGTLCVHPQDPQLLISRHASRRYYPEFADTGWVHEARRLAGRIHLDFIKPISTMTE